MVSSEEPKEPIFTISTSSERLHVYSTVESLLASLGIDSAPPDGFDFDDALGRRLAPVLDQSGKFVGLRLAGGLPDEAGVCKRLITVIDHLRDSVDDLLARSQPHTVTREQALQQLPDLEGKGLAECYGALKAVFGEGTNSTGADDNDGSFFHNLFCHCC